MGLDQKEKRGEKAKDPGSNPGGRMLAEVQLEIEMALITVIGVSIFTLPFCIIALHSLREYLNDRQNPQKKHILYAFLCISTGFISGLIGAAMASPEMGPEKLMIVNTLFRSFDAFNMLGAFWFFVFLTDFIERMKKYIPFVVIHLGITLILILLTPARVTMLGTEPAIERAGIRSLAILFFWFLYWGIIAYEFWKYSRVMTKKVPIRRSQMMGAGAVFAVSAYVFTEIAGISQDIIFKLLSHTCAALSGIVFYAGFVAPEWLRKRWER